MDAFGKPVCFTYFWLESDDGSTLDVLKIPDNDIEYFLTAEQPAGSECINKDMQETDELWGADRWPDEDRAFRGQVLKKHPNKNICQANGSVY